MKNINNPTKPSISNSNIIHNLYVELEKSKLIAEDDFRKYFNPKGIRFPVEFQVKLRKAELASIINYLDTNGPKEFLKYLEQQDKDTCDSIKENLKEFYIKQLLVPQLNEIQYKKWKHIDRYLSMISLYNDQGLL